MSIVVVVEVLVAAVAVLVLNALVVFSTTLKLPILSIISVSCVPFVVGVVVLLKAAKEDDKQDGKFERCRENDECVQD